MTSGWLEVAREAAKLPALLSDIYGDLLKPGVRQVGKALETVIGLGNTALWPIALANERARISLERNFEKYREQMNDVPEEKVSPIPPEIGVPVAEKLAYVSDEELSQLYVNLLAKASTVDTAHFAHPSFVNVINNLCPDEAIILKALHRTTSVPFITANLYQKDKKNQFTTIGDLLTGLETRQKLAFPRNTVAYMSNFEGLGLIQIRRDVHLADAAIYTSLENLYRPSFLGLEGQDNLEIKFKKGKIEVTPFGSLFINACLTKLAKRG
ncbi:DUF4393 domain-containing protein [Solimonas fluminis]|nr:DUF4393 domain-containing protein [Solimonas fluminis]